MTTQAHTASPWHTAKVSGGQGLIIGGDGANVAVSYDARDAALIAAAPELLDACRCALADLEGIMPEFEPSGDRQHPAWQTIQELRDVIRESEGDA